jgi:hypothetical protein
LIGLAAITLAVVTMVFDHLVGSDPGLEDPVAFVITVGLTFLVPLLPGRGHADGGGAGAGPDPDSKAPQTL